MKTITENMTLGEVVVEVPKSSDILRELHIDFVNHGHQQLGDAAFERGLPIENILYEINELDTENTDGIDIKYMDEISIIKYIQRRYHEDLKDELPVLEPYIEKMVKQESGLGEVMDIFRSLKKSLLEHIEEEDASVFPLLESYIGSPSESKKEALRPRVTKIKNEHRDVTEFFYRLREVTNDFTPHEGASGVLRLVYDRLGRLESDTLDHIHLENNILFERVNNPSLK
ncbi:DUF542 domain-containing protein [Salinicoccus sp. HZC-1]|uniref:DUF542 domain-containing protein n=1 Tax=Salinicoccus sp. HZC-1 TaxID=3385497 RepID=UPI00398BB26F